MSISRVNGTVLATGTMTSSMVMSTSTSTSNSSRVSCADKDPISCYPNRDPTPYGFNHSAVPAPKSQCVPLNTTLEVTSNTATLANQGYNTGSIFAACCAPQPVYVYADTCAIYCPFYAKPGESQTKATSRLAACLQGRGLNYNTLGISTSFVNATGNASYTPTSLGAVATASTGAAAIAAARPMGLLQTALISLPLIMTVLGASVVV